MLDFVVFVAMDGAVGMVVMVVIVVVIVMVVWMRVRNAVEVFVRVQMAFVAGFGFFVAHGATLRRFARAPRTSQERRGSGSIHLHDRSRRRRSSANAYTA